MSLEKQMEYFCKRLTAIRKEHNLSKEEMALSLKISLKDLEKIEKGILPNSIPCDIIFRVERRFGISIKDQFSKK